MAEGITETAQPGPATPALSRWAGHLFRFYMVMVPALAIFGALHMQGAPGDNLRALFKVHVALNWVLWPSLIFAGLAYLAVTTELCKPPRNPWLALVFTFDAPVLVAAGALAGGSPNLGMLAYDGAVEICAVVLGLAPIAFTGSVRVAAKRGADIPKALAMIAALSAGPMLLVGALVKGMVAEANWEALGGMLAALGWSTYSYYRLVRHAPAVKEDPTKWIVIGIMLPLLGGIVQGVVRGLMRGM